MKLDKKDQFILLNEINALDAQYPVSLTRVEKKEFYFEIEVANALAGNQGQALIQWLENYFGGLPVRLNNGSGHTMLIQVSRVQKNLEPKLHQFYRLMEANRSKGWFLGVGNFGPEFFDYNKLIHAYLGGSSGFGKSTIFKSLIAQNAAFNDTAFNVIIDPKGVDYSAFRGHPRIPVIAKSGPESKQVMQMLWIELGVRRHFFNGAFENVPSNLNEYRKLRAEHNRTDLPDFKHIFIWVDEFASFLDQIQWTHIEHHHRLILLARAFGIHFIGTAQRFSSDCVPNLFHSQCSHTLAVYSPNIHWSSNSSFEMVHTMMGTGANKPIPGRLNVLDTLNNEYRTIQTPNSTDEELIGLAFSGSPVATEADSFYRLQVADVNILRSGLIGESIWRYGALPNAENLKKISTEMRFQTYSEFLQAGHTVLGTPEPFAFSHLYNIKKAA